MHAVRVVAHVLEDVDLAAGGPTAAEVVGHHPDGGPSAPSSGHLDASLYATVAPRGLALRLQAGRRVLVAVEVVAPPFDHQVTVLDARVLLAAIGVVLELVVHPARALHFVGPLALVDG